MTDKVTELRVLELFCGVGGMHMALSGEYCLSMTNFLGIHWNTAQMISFSC